MPCARVSLPRSNVNCSTVAVSKPRSKLAWQSSSSSKGGTTHNVATPRSTICRQSITRGITSTRLLPQAQHRPSKRGNSSASLVAGVDVGGGESETVVYICECRRDRRRIIAMGAWRGTDTRGGVVNFLNQYRPQVNLVRVDA